jgi:recombination protein RecT
MNIDTDKIKGAYAVAIMSDGSKITEVMNINQLKKAWNQRMGGLKEDATSTHTKFRDQMAKKTVINRLCKIIANTSTDGNISEISDRLDEVESVDMVAEDVTHDVEVNSSTVDFAPDEVEVVDVPQESENIPAFMEE